MYNNIAIWSSAERYEAGHPPDLLIPGLYPNFKGDFVVTGHNMKFPNPSNIYGTSGSNEILYNVQLDFPADKIIAFGNLADSLPANQEMVVVAEQGSLLAYGGLAVGAVDPSSYPTIDTGGVITNSPNNAYFGQEGGTPRGITFEEFGGGAVYTHAMTFTTSGSEEMLKHVAGNVDPFTYKRSGTVDQFRVYYPEAKSLEFEMSPDLGKTVPWLNSTNGGFPQIPNYFNPSDTVVFSEIISEGAPPMRMFYRFMPVAF
ncbi:MAG: hypothetical protein ABF384_06740 [Verrucomicrobiales bacterium]